ncbi:MAG: hypothetical protein IPJ81_06815 [Chitinophagaceae bacterium]|nr:hypothetical protein [Chitinophagaceae bacterium]
MTVDFMYKLMLEIINKNQQGYLPPAGFNNYINQSSISYMSFLFGQTQQYSPGRPIARVELGMNEILAQRLAPFVDPIYTLTINGSGVAPYPPNYEQIVAMFTNTGLQRIRYAEKDKIYSLANSVIDPVATNPIYSIQNNGFQFYPITLGNAKISYVKTPPEIIWAFILDDKGRAIYDAGNSVDPLWNDVDCLEIITRALAMVGVNLQSAAVIQYANQITKGGQ